MNTKKMMAVAQDGAMNHVLPIVGGVAAGQFLGKHRLIVGLGATVVALMMNKPQFATAGAAAALTPLLPTSSTGGVDGLSTKDGSARLQTYFQQVKEGAWPFSAKPATKATVPAGTSGLGYLGDAGMDTVYSDYASAMSGLEGEGDVLLGTGDTDGANYANDGMAPSGISLSALASL